MALVGFHFHIESPSGCSGCLGCDEGRTDEDEGHWALWLGLVTAELRLIYSGGRRYMMMWDGM